MLAWMARDYLAIQGSASPSERAFSQGGLTDTKWHNHLSPAAFAVLQLLKSGYCNGHIQAVQQAEEYCNKMMDEFEDNKENYEEGEV
jgi:hypothetical protein